VATGTIIVLPWPARKVGITEFTGGTTGRHP
jgi:hypothetical protein